MSRSLARVRELIGSHEPGRGKRYPVTVQREVVRYALGRRAEGASWARIADELGLWFETVRRWCEAPTSAGAIVPVEIVHEAPTRTAEVAIVSPSGFRLVGLDAASALAALKALG